MTSDVVEQAGTRLGRTELAPVVDELFRRFGDGVAPSSITLLNLDEKGQIAVADLLGESRLRATRRLAVGRLVEVLGLADADELRGVIELLRGPLPDRRADRTRRDADRLDLWHWLRTEAEYLTLSHDTSWVGPWVEFQRRAGIRGGLPSRRSGLERAMDVLRMLPADGVPLAALAADVCGDPHALDPGRSTTAAVLAAMALALRSEMPADAESARVIWETFGVAPDPLSSTVLSLALDAPAGHALADFLGRSRQESEAVVLTLAQLRRWPLPPLPSSATIYVVENPSLIAAAASQGMNGALLICSSGRPTVAVVTLLRQLGAGGCRLLQHADFDSVGISITNWLAERAGTIPWRMQGSDYSAALSDGRERLRLKTTVPATPWDSTLATVMMSAGVAVFEEEVRQTLLQEIH